MGNLDLDKLAKDNPELLCEMLPSKETIMAIGKSIDEHDISAGEAAAALAVLMLYYLENDTRYCEFLVKGMATVLGDKKCFNHDDINRKRKDEDQVQQEKKINST
jgi:hypothetical protein